MDLYGYGSCFACILTLSPGEIQQFQGEDTSVVFFFFGWFRPPFMSRWTKQTEFHIRNCLENQDAVNFHQLETPKTSDPMAKIKWYTRCSR